MKKKPIHQSDKKAQPVVAQSSWQLQTVLDFLMLLGYLMVHFIPAMERLDVIGPHWYYISILDVVVLLYLVFFRKDLFENLWHIFSAPFVILYSVFVVWAAASWFYAINGNEMIVCFARLSSTFIAFVNIALFLRNQKKFALLLAYAFLVVGAYESLVVLNQFFTSFNNQELDALILSLTGNAGNKNITASSIVIKLPFILYVLNRKGVANKLAGVAGLFLLLLALFILNARSSYLSVIAILSIFVVATYFLRDKAHSWAISFNSFIYVVGVFALAVGLSVYLFSAAASITGKEAVYSNSIKRITTISVTNAGSSGRLDLWSSALKHLKDNPVFGAGYGNWKLASIPYEKYIANDFTVAYHAHNDFLEIGAELGFPGLSIYVSMFVLLIIAYIRNFLNKQIVSEEKQLLLVGFVALVAYLIDAIFNFPTERTLMQVNFAFAAGFIFIGSADAYKSTSNASGLLKYCVATVFLLIATFSLFINAQVDESLKGQALFYSDMGKGNKDLGKLDMVFPEYPNLAYNTMPIKAIEARYKLKEDKTEEALSLLNQAETENPYLYYPAFLKTSLYFDLGNTDSAYKYANLTFEHRPRSLSAYKNWTYACFKKSDTAALYKAFKQFIQYRDEADAWRSFLVPMVLLKKKDDAKLIALADSAIKKFPDSLALFTQIKKDLQSSNDATQGKQSSNGIGIRTFTPEQVAEARMFSDKATSLFNKKQFDEAASAYLSAAKIDTENFSLYENAAISYYNAGKHDLAVKKFNLAISKGGLKALKSYYFKGVSLNVLGKKEEACASIKFALDKGYKGDEQFFKSICK